MPSSSIGSATNANVSEIAKYGVPTDQTAPSPPTFTATPRHTNLLPPSFRIAGSDISARRREVAAMAPRDAIGKPDICKALLSPIVRNLGALCLHQCHLGLVGPPECCEGAFFR